MGADASRDVNPFEVPEDEDDGMIGLAPVVFDEVPEYIITDVNDLSHPLKKKVQKVFGEYYFSPEEFIDFD